MTRFEGHRMAANKFKRKKVSAAFPDLLYHTFEPKDTRHEKILPPSSPVAIFWNWMPRLRFADGARLNAYAKPKPRG